MRIHNCEKFISSMWPFHWTNLDIISWRIAAIVTQPKLHCSRACYGDVVGVRETDHPLWHAWQIEHSPYAATVEHVSPLNTSCTYIGKPCVLQSSSATRCSPH